MKRKPARPVLVGMALLLPCASPAAEPAFEDAFRQLEGEQWPAPNEFRSASGAPGPRYWQQQVDYEIEARLDEPARKVGGRAAIHYRNRSPDTLAYLWLLLDQNAYRRDSMAQLTRTVDGNTASGRQPDRIAPASHWQGGLDISAVRDSSGDDLPFRIRDTLMRVDLPRPLPPGGETRFHIEWSYTLADASHSAGFGGYGCADGEEKCIFQVGAWFPRLAAYTDYEGWHTQPFLAGGGGEFTLEFGDYRVALTVPGDHVVAATGELRNASQVLTARQAERLRRAAASDVPVFVVTPAEAHSPARARAPAERTWVFEARSVRDFAWASSRGFIWDAQGVAVRGVERPVLAMSFYASAGRPLWEQYSTRALAHSVETFSELLFPYPYPVIQSVDGPMQGMEFPMISFNGARPARDEKTGRPVVTDRLRNGFLATIFHEAGHNYFPMIVNTDERQWTWLDEGLAAYLQYRGEKAWDPRFPSWRGEPRHVVEYMRSPGQTPVMTQADSVLRPSDNAYAKPAAAFTLLRETILGPEVFDGALREFAERWRFRRATPYDFFRTLEESSGVDLDWFWRAWFYGSGHVDLAIDRVWRVTAAGLADGPDLYRFDFRNVGGMVMPILLDLTYDDGSRETVHIPAEIWRRNARAVTWEWATTKTLARAEIDPRQETADTDRANNTVACALACVTAAAHVTPGDAGQSTVALVAPAPGVTAATGTVDAASAWMKAVPLPSVPRKPRILLIHDMEGLAGQDDPYSFLFGHARYPETRELLTADVNAVIDGLFAGGAGSVSVADGHGSGNPEADLLIDRLDARARMVTRPESFDPYVDLAEPGAFDAIAVVGMHAKSGSGGFASHTYSLGSQISVNGHSITETELVALLHGQVGVPVIFASGDDRLAQDLASMPWIQYVTTKKAKTAWSAELLPVDQVRKELRKRATLAVRQLERARVIRLEGPVRMAVHAIAPSDLSWLADFPGVDYTDQTIRFSAPDMSEAYRSLRPVVWAMGGSFSEAERSVLDAHPDGRRIRFDGQVELFRRWLDSESGRSPLEAASSSPALGKHHGFH